MNMAGAAVNANAGGPVGGGMMMMNPNSGSPALPVNNEKSLDYLQATLNTYVYEYFLKLRHYDLARALVNEEKFIMKTGPRQSPNHRKDGEVNGTDGDPMDMNGKDDIPDDLPQPQAPDSGKQGNGFLFEWFSVFSDIFTAHRSPNKMPNHNNPAMQYLIQHQQSQRMRELQQNQNMRSGGIMNPQFMRNGQMRNGMMNGDMAKQRLTPQQMAMLQQSQKTQMQQMRGDQSEGDPNARPATPGEGDNGGSPSKRPRLENGQPFNGGMMPNGRPVGVPGTGQQGMLMQSGFNPNNMNNAQFRQNGGAMPPKGMPANMASSMMNMSNSASPMMPGMSQFPDNIPVDMYSNRGMANQGMPGVNNGQSGNHALQDYQMQLMLLEQQNKKRLMMARQEQHDNNPRDGQPMTGAMAMQPGMSPSGSRSGTSPNPTDQMKRNPQLGGVPGSPATGDMQGRSPNPMTFMGGMPPGDFGQNMFLKEGQAMMGPGGPNMRPPIPGDVNAMNRAAQQQQQQQQHQQQQHQQQQQQQQQQAQQQQQQARMFANGQPMQQQPSQGQPQPVGTPGQRNTEMPPPPGPAANSAQRNNQPASPANSNNAPPTPSQGNKPNPKNKKNATKDGPDRKRTTKKNSTANAPSSEDNPPATPTPSTPMTPGHPNNFNGSGGKGPAQAAQQPNQQTQPNIGMAPNQPQMVTNDINQQNGFPDFSKDFPNNNDQNFNLDFSTLENTDVLENFDFDSFLNTSNDDATFTFDGGIVGDFGMDGPEG